MSGRVFISEYNNMGDVAPSMALEPLTLVQEVAIGSVSDGLHHDTRMVMLFSDMPCKLHFFADGDVPDERRAFPMKNDYEIQRLVHMGTKMRIATFPLD
jgi:hypothetical protein